ncbi:MAG: hypothetical protein U9P79_09730 [Candidatus Cloacimonadota bacterium]|nr:hypothetical protein [Candidatus Cloacimonadota bacterium]
MKKNSLSVYGWVKNGTHYLTPFMAFLGKCKGVNALDYFGCFFTYLKNVKLKKE